MSFLHRLFGIPKSNTLPISTVRRPPESSDDRIGPQLVRPVAPIVIPPIPIERDSDAQPVGRGYNESRRRDRSVHEALGLIKGILADDIVMPSEVIALSKWLLANVGSDPGWPLDIVLDRVSGVLADGIITNEECEDLRVLFRQITAEGNAPLGRNSATRLPLTEPSPPVLFALRRFVFTGKFIYGTRNACEMAVTDRGGQCSASVSIKTDFLVIGYIGSEDWMFTNFGRKIQMAVENIHQGARTAIIAEEYWTKHL